MPSLPLEQYHLEGMVMACTAAHVLGELAATGDSARGTICVALLSCLLLGSLLKLSGLHAQLDTPGARPCASQSIAICHALSVLQGAAVWAFAHRQPYSTAASLQFLQFQALLACGAAALSQLLLAIPHDVMTEAFAVLRAHHGNKIIASLVAMLSVALAAFASRTLAALSDPQVSLAQLLQPTGAHQLYAGVAAAFAMVSVQRTILRRMPETFTVGEAWLVGAGWTHAALWLAYRCISSVQYAQQSARSDAQAHQAVQACVRAAVRALTCADCLPVTIAVSTLGMCCVAPQTIVEACSACVRWAQKHASGAARGARAAGAGAGDDAAPRPRLFTNLLNMDSDVRGNMQPDKSSGESSGSSDAAGNPAHDAGGPVGYAGRAPSRAARALKGAAWQLSALLPGREHNFHRQHAARSAARISLFAAFTTLLAACAKASIARVLARRSRCLTLAAWVLGVGTGLPAITALHRRAWLPATVLRKAFHALALLLFVPVLAADAELLALALAIAIAVLAVLEVLRIAQFPVIAQPLTAFMARFADARDGGAATISHLSLLAGIAVPLWLALPPVTASPGGAIPPQPLLRDAHPTASGSAPEPGVAGQAGVPVAAWVGLLSLGVADSAAATVGCMCGRMRMFWGTNKTVEGCAAGAASLAVCMGLALAGGAAATSAAGLAPVLLGWRVLWSAMLIALLEASTEQLDNLVMPVHACTLVMVLL